MSVYNATFMNNATNIVDLMTGIGIAMNQEYLFGHMLLFGFFLIFLILAFKHDFLAVLIIDGFICTLLSILMWTVGLIPVSSIIYPLLTLIIAILFYLFT